jgi:threonine 3-dehydrogenase
VIAGKNDAPRLESLRRMGFSETVDVGERTLEEALARYFAQGKFDVVVEATGVPPIVQQGLNVLRKRGVLVIVGIHPQPAAVNLTRLVREHQQIRGSYRAPLATWQRVLDFLTANAEVARQMITHRLPLDSAIEGLELSRTKGASKVIIVQ